jgi:hypothetical protein
LEMANGFPDDFSSLNAAPPRTRGPG